MEQKCRITLMRSAIIKKASQDDQQNQSTKTANIKYIQKFMSIQKKNLQKLKKASDKTETKQNNGILKKKIRYHSIKRLANL